MTVVDLLGDYRGSESVRGTGSWLGPRRSSQDSCVARPGARSCVTHKRGDTGWRGEATSVTINPETSARIGVPSQNRTSSHTLDWRATVCKLTEWTQNVVFNRPVFPLNHSDGGIILAEWRENHNMKSPDGKHDCSRWNIGPVVLPVVAVFVCLIWRFIS